MIGSNDPNKIQFHAVDLPATIRRTIATTFKIRYSDHATVDANYIGIIITIHFFSFLNLFW